MHHFEINNYNFQWRNRRGWGGQSAPRDFWPVNFCWPTGKKEGRKKGKEVEIEKKRRKILNGKVENWKWKVEKLQNEQNEDKMMRGPFFFFFAFRFSKPLKFVLGLPKWKFSTGKKTFHAGKKIRKNDFAPLRKIFLLHPWLLCGVVSHGALTDSRPIQVLSMIKITVIPPSQACNSCMWMRYTGICLALFKGNFRLENWTDFEWTRLKYSNC